MLGKNRKHAAAAVFTAGVLATALFTGGCGSGRDADAEKEYRTQGIEQMQAGDYSSALDSFTKALDNAGKKFGDLELDISYYKALAEFKTGDSQAAIETYTGIMDYDDANYSPYYLRGCVYAAEGDSASAIQDFDQAVSMDEDDYELYINIYYAFSGADDQTDGQTYLQQALELDGDSADEQAQKGYIQYLLGDTDQADSTLTDAVDAGSVQAMLYRGVMFAESGDTDSAMTWFDQYYEEKSDDVDAVLALASTALDAGAPEAAQIYFEDAQDLAETEEQKQNAAKGLISAYESSGDYDSAYTTLKEYISNYPDDEAAQKELEYVQTRI